MAAGRVARDGPFRGIAIDQLFESPTNPRQTFDQKKLEELAARVADGTLDPFQAAEDLLARGTDWNGTD